MIEIAINDSLDFAVNLLIDSWNPSNTDDRTPDIKKIVNVKRVPQSHLTMDDKDQVLLRTVDITPVNASIGAGARNINHRITIDSRSTWSSADVSGTEHKLKLMKEIDRIMQENIVLDPSTGFNILDPDGGVQDFDNRSTGLYRFTYDVVLEQHTEGRTA